MPEEKKIICLMPVRNDSWILRATLPCILEWADIVIVADQGSTDESREICKSFPRVEVIENPDQFHSTKVRQKLLEAARKHGKNNIIFSIDSDEIISSDILDGIFITKMKNMPPGACVELQWVQLWKSLNNYRDDKSVWSDSWKVFAFVDDGISGYEITYSVNDHNPRVPPAMLKNKIRLPMPKVLHLQFVLWERMLAKQRFYRVQDFLQTKKTFTDALRINRMYFITKDGQKEGLSPVPENWLGGYAILGPNFELQKENFYWYDYEILKWFAEIGLKTFDVLDIWDYDWENSRVKALSAGRGGVPTFKIIDPRSWAISAYQKLQPQIYSVVRAVKKIA